MQVTVVGAGVIGLTAAHALAGRGHRVRVITRDDPLATTSATAAASFKPRLVADDATTTMLLDRSHHVLGSWDGTVMGDVMALSRIRHVEASARPITPRHHLDVMADVRQLSADGGDDLPVGMRHAISYETWFMDVALAMPALVEAVRARGVEVVVGAVTSLADALVMADNPSVVVNATGMGAAKLAHDADLVPVRGQVVALPRGSSDITTSTSADGTYVYPRSGDILVGGTTDLDAWDLVADPVTTRRLVAAATRLEPTLAGAVPVDVQVGLRPWRRRGVRLELQPGTPAVVHAYGHGGAGWTLAPGTAEWIADVVDDLGHRS